MNSDVCSSDWMIALYRTAVDRAPDGQGQVVGGPIDRRAVEGDHPGRTPLLAVGALEPREERQRGLDLRGPFPDAHRVATLADHVVGVAERQRPGQEAAVGAHGVLEVRERGGCASA